MSIFLLCRYSTTCCLFSTFENPRMFHVPTLGCYLGFSEVTVFQLQASITTTFRPSKTSMHLEKYKNFSSFRWPETRFRHAQGHQRASAITGSLNIFPSTISTVYEVVHQKTVNTKLGRQTIWLSEVIKEFYNYLQEKQAGRHTKIESKVALHSQNISIDVTESDGQKVQAFLKNRPEYTSN